MTLSAVSADQPHQFRAQAADTAARTIDEAEPELEKLVRSGYAAVVAWDRRGEAERAAYNLARLRPRFVDDHEHLGEGLWFAQARLREGFIAPQLKIAVIPDHRLLRRRRAERPEGTRGRAFQAFTELRPGDVVVHTDHGIGRFTGFDTKTVAERHARLPRGRVPRRRPRLRAHRPARSAVAATSAPTAPRRRCRSSAPRPGTT